MTAGGHRTTLSDQHKNQGEWLQLSAKQWSYVLLLRVAVPLSAHQIRLIIKGSTRRSRVVGSTFKLACHFVLLKSKEGLSYKLASDRFKSLVVPVIITVERSPENEDGNLLLPHLILRLFQ